MADEFERRAHVQLVGENMPTAFYANGSQLVPAKLQAFEVQDGVLRLDRRSHNGTLGSFWVDLATHKVIKTQFGR